MSSKMNFVFMRAVHAPVPVESDNVLRWTLVGILPQESEAYVQSTKVDPAIKWMTDFKDQFD
ncbi:hypothetical protein AAVH_33081 [Aphelenchoides avenae]|nr:hypothetical protein AAVH_33081 [Aphelenchus avenae]